MLETVEMRAVALPCCVPLPPVCRLQTGPLPTSELLTHAGMQSVIVRFKHNLYQRCARIQTIFCSMPAVLAGGKGEDDKRASPRSVLDLPFHTTKIKAMAMPVACQTPLVSNKLRRRRMSMRYCATIFCFRVLHHASHLNATVVIHN